MLVSLVALSACSNESVSKSKADDEIVATSATETTGSGTETTAVDLTNPTGLSIVSPSTTGTYTTGTNWNVVRGVTSSDTNAIEVNGYRLHKYVAGSTNWNYIAATKMQTLSAGQNEYVVKAFDKDENVIDQVSFQINYQSGYVLPNVGAGLNVVFILTILLTFGLFLRRQKI